MHRVMSLCVTFDYLLLITYSIVMLVSPHFLSQGQKQLHQNNVDFVLEVLKRTKMACQKNSSHAMTVEIVVLDDERLLL
jgi:hypothetical protein